MMHLMPSHKMLRILLASLPSRIGGNEIVSKLYYRQSKSSNDTKNISNFKIGYQREVDGVITVYLSLILLIILSLIFTVIEGARICVARVNAERALTMAMDSVMAEYYEPLWKEYHIFGLDASYGSDQVQENVMAEKLEGYMSYTLYPNMNPRYSNWQNGVELYNTSIKDLAIKDRTMLTDHNGELFLHQAVEYMKYREVAKAAEELLDQMSLLESPSTVSMIYEEKLKVEEKLVEIDKGILELMELFDGVKTNKRGLEITNAGKLKVVPYFIKKICIGDIGKETVGINNEEVFLALKDNYMVPEKEFNAIDESFIQLNEILAQIEEKEAEIASVDASLSKAYQVLAQAYANQNDTDEKTDNIKKMEEEIKALESKKDILVKTLKERIKNKDAQISNILINKKNIEKVISKLLPLIDKAIKVINKILLTVNSSAPHLEAYETLLHNEKEGLDDMIINDLLDDLELLKRYSSEDGIGYDFIGMKRILEYDKSILQQTEDALDKALQELSQKHYANARVLFQNTWEILSKYQVQGLTLDYSSLITNIGETADFLSAIQSTILGGITGLVVKQDTISMAKLSDGWMPSDLTLESQERNITEITSLINNSIKSNEISNIGSIFGGLNNVIGNTSSITGSLNYITETLLLTEYIKEHFYSYPNEGEEEGSRKPSRLTYEQEYVLVGKMEDEKNLSSIIARLIAIRMAADLVTILMDETIRSEAKVVATAMVGFTGMPILISIVQTLILILLSFAEALVDACALLKGKEVPILKKEIVIRLNDLLLLTHEKINAKAQDITNANGIAMSYRDYLSIFLLFSNRVKTIYRSMDLIEENLKLRYHDDFSFKNCLFGFDTETMIYIKPKFTGFKFVQEYLYHRQDFNFLIKSGYCY